MFGFEPNKTGWKLRTKDWDIATTGEGQKGEFSRVKHHYFTWKIHFWSKECFFPFFSLAIAASQILRKNCWRTRSMPSMLYWMRRSSTANSSSWAPPRRTWAVVFWGTGGVVRGKNIWPILALNSLDYFCSRNRINCVKIWWFSTHVRLRRRVNPEWREVSWSRSIGYNYCVYLYIYIHAICIV